MENQHIPVMLKAVLAALDPRPGEVVIDCTLGGGAYARAIAARVGEDGLVAALDADAAAIKLNQKIIKEQKIKNIKLCHENFKDLPKIFEMLKTLCPEKKISGLVFDLGLSSQQLADGRRGFSFQLDAPLDMAFGGAGQAPHPTFDIVNRYKAHSLERIIREYGEEKFAHSIAAAIVRARQNREIKTSGQLAGIIAEAVPGRYRRGRIHCATRTFQALRIKTNDELGALASALKSGLAGLDRGGRIAVVSFHSLEDRIVKNFFKTESKDCLCPKEAPECRCRHRQQLKILTKKPLTPSAAEVKANPRARSAKLRAAKKI